MRIFGVVIVCMLVQLPAMSQKYFRLGVTGGFNFSFATAKENGNSSNYNPRSGVMGGITGEIALYNTRIFLQPGLQYIQKGGVFNSGAEDVKIKTRFHYLEVPLMVIFKEDTKDAKFVAGLGPVLGIGLGGREKVDRQYNEAINFGGDPENDDFKRGEIGAAVLVGMEFVNNISLSVLYNRALSSISLDKNISFKNQYIGVRVGFVIFKK